MKGKSLCTMLLFLFAMASAMPSYADGKDVSGKVWNADCEKGMSGWEVTFTTADNENGLLWKTSRHTEGASPNALGYWGFKGRCLEIWGGQTDGVGNPVGKNSITQRITGLPNGTYVFGAFTIATIQNDGTSENSTRYIPTKDDVNGAYMFANDVVRPIATNNPESADSATWAHAVKINVAAQVTDGTLTFGFGCEEGTTASFLSFDNVTLYYFSDAEPETALAEAYKMDLQKAIAAADTLKRYTMATAERAGIDVAAEASASAASAEEYMAAEEAVRLAARYARASIIQYDELAGLIARAKDVLSKEWSEYVADEVDALREAVQKAESDRENGAITTEEMAGYMRELDNTIGKVELDELFSCRDALEEFINFPEVISEFSPNMFCGSSHPGFGEEPGQYPLSEKDVLNSLLEEVDKLIEGIDTGATSATEGKAMIDRIWKAVSLCMYNIIQPPHLPMDVILIPDPNDPTKAYVSPDQAGANTSNAYMQTFKGVSAANGQECFRYESPVFTLPYPIERLVMSVIHTAWADRSADPATDGPYFNLNEFYLYDEFGNQIPLKASDFHSNAVEVLEGSYAGLCDGTLSGFFHSSWSQPAKPKEYYHNISVAMPEGMVKFSIAFEVYWHQARIFNMPTEVVFSSESRALTDLLNAIATAEDGFSSYCVGNEPGFYTGELCAINSLKETIREVDAIARDGSSTDEQLVAAMNRLEKAVGEAKTAAEAMTMNLPTAGVGYQISNQAGFVKRQSKVKNMTVLQDSILWWADADPADNNQDFVFEPIAAPADAGDGDIFLAVKNVGTGKYIGPFVQRNGVENGAEIVWGNAWHIRLTDMPTPILFKPIGNGQFQMWSAKELIDTDWLCLHACNHNNGTATDNPGSEGGGKGGTHPDGYSIHGVCGPIVQWETGINEASAWYIRQQEELPLSILIDEGFEERAHHLCQPVDVMTLTADKPCTFTGLLVTDVLGDTIDCSIRQNDAYSTVVNFAEHTETFCLHFDNVEDVATVTITGGIAEKTPRAKLQEAYDAIAQVEYTVGPNIGQVKDLTALDAAKAHAEAMLTSAEEFTMEEADATIAMLRAAVDALEVIGPEDGKTYFIVNATSAFEENFGVPVAIYANPDNGMSGWTYLSINNPCYEWAFEFVDDTKHDFRLYNIGAQSCLSGNTGANLVMNENGGLYTLVARGAQKFNFLNTDPGAQNDGTLSGTWLIHANKHSNGSSPLGSLCYWGNERELSEWYILESGNLRTAIDVVSTDSEPLNAVGGIYDLTGRRVGQPTKGIYIQNGKKVLVR